MIHLCPRGCYPTSYGSPGLPSMTPLTQKERRGIESVSTKKVNIDKVTNSEQHCNIPLLRKTVVFDYKLWWPWSSDSPTGLRWGHQDTPKTRDTRSRTMVKTWVISSPTEDRVGTDGKELSTQLGEYTATDGMSLHKLMEQYLIPLHGTTSQLP